MQNLIAKNNKTLLEKLIPEKGSVFEYEKGMKFTDPFDMAFDHPFECSLPHIKSKENEEDNHLFI
jgi:hypothetical protein